MLSAFLSYSYKDQESESIARVISNLLRTQEVKAIEGKDLDPAEGLNRQIMERIDAVHVLIGIRLSHGTSSYLEQEIGYATGKGIPVVVITNDESGGKGLIKDQYHLRIDKGELQLATELLVYINKIKNTRSVSIQPTYSQHSHADEIDNEGWTPEVRERLRELRALITSNEFGLALDISVKIIEVHPDCWRAYIAKNACLVHMYRFEEAEESLNEVLKKFSGNRRALSYAWQNKGWISQRKSTEFTEEDCIYRIDCYQQSKKYEERVVVYGNLIKNLLMLNKVEEAESELTNCLSAFPNCREEFLRQLEAQGAEFNKEIAKSGLLNALLFPKNSKGG